MEDAQTIGLIIFGILALCVVISGIACLWCYGSSDYNPNARHACPCCGKSEEECYCSSC